MRVGLRRALVREATVVPPANALRCDLAEAEVAVPLWKNLCGVTCVCCK
jgi:hypothetical protein